MDIIEQLKQVRIITKSLDAAAYVVYMTNCPVDIVVNNENGFKLFAINRNKETERFYNEYKENKGELYLDIVKYNRIIHRLKTLCRDYGA